MGFLGGFDEIIPYILGTAAGTEHRLRCGSSSGGFLLFLPFSFLPRGHLGLDVPGRKSQVPREVPVEDRSFRGDRGGSALTRRQVGRCWSPRGSVAPVAPSEAHTP